MKTDRIRRFQLVAMTLLLIASALAFPFAALAEPLLAPTDRPMRAETVVRNIEAPSDDADQGSGAANPNGDVLTIGDAGFGTSHAGLRFTDITIPQGATIQEAHLVLSIVGGSSSPMMVTIRGHAVADSPAFSSGDGPADRQGESTTASVGWNITGSTVSTIVSTPNLANVIQEIISRPDWNPGNALGLMLFDESFFELGYLQVKAWEGPGAEAPAQLLITYAEPSPGVGAINPSLYVSEEYTFLGNPDLVVTHVDTDRSGYPASDVYTITVEVKNLGAGDSGPFDIVGQIGRYYDGGVTLTWGIGPELTLAGSFTIASVPNLVPGEILFIEADPRSLGMDVFPDSIEPSGVPLCCWVENLPNWGQVFLKVSATAPETEFFTDNNASTAWFIYPNRPEGYLYEAEQDRDGDGFYPPEDCNDDDPFIHPHAEELPGDDADNDCDLQEWYQTMPPGWERTGLDELYGDYDRDGDGWTFNQGDCNDSNPDIFPGRWEINNDLDDNCDGLVDEGIDIVDPNAQDADGDGWSVGEGDCDDFQGGINPGAYEIPDGLDNDCDTFIDEGFLTPDWTVGLTLERRDTDCQYNPDQEGYLQSDWPWSPLCGIQATYIVGNEGESLGSSSAISDQVRILDLAGREFSAFTPYIEFPSLDYAVHMACDAAGLIASVPGGLMGEENVSNNWDIFTLPARVRDLDIVQDHISLSYPNTADNSQTNFLSVSLRGDIEGSCPPATFFWGYTTRVSIFVDGEQVGTYERNAWDPAGQVGLTPYYLSERFHLQDRPRDNAEIRIEVLLNSDERFDEDPGNNLCVINLTYDRNPAGFANWIDPNTTNRINDRMILENAEGCTASLTLEQLSVGSLTSSLNIRWTFILVMVVLLGVGLAGGGLLAGRIVQRFGVAGAGHVASSIAGALLGGVVLVSAAIGIAALAEQQEVDVNMPGTSFQPASDDITGLLLESDDPQIASCEDLAASSMQVVMTDAGTLEDVLIQLQPAEGADLTAGSSFSVTLWESEGNPMAVLTTEEMTLSLASEGLLPEIGDTLIWQVVVESDHPDGLTCLPAIRAFVVGAEAEEVAIDEPGGPTVTVTPAPPDTTPPSVKSTSAVPNPAFTTTPVTISANIADQTGIAAVDLYYQMGKGAVQYGGAMLHYGGGVYSIQIGPLFPAGTYDYYILAADTLGNANCTVATIGTCPGGSIVVIIP